jgi:AcrR family transcriptional regulator
MVTKKVKTKPKDREATEERLLLAAEQVFSKYGFQGATTRMIAKKADINIALITRYFDGKYGLLLKVITNKANNMRSSLLNYEPKESVTEECLAYANFRIETCMEDLNFFRIVIAMFLTDSKFLKRFQESLLDFKTNVYFEERLKNLLDNKKMTTAIPIPVIFDSVESYIFGTIISKAIIHGGSREEIKLLVEDFIKSFCIGLEKK